MPKDVLYPTNLENLYKNMEYIIDNEQNIEVVNSILDWKMWFEELNYEITYECGENEFLKIYSSNGKYSLQVWSRSNIADSLIRVLISNYYDTYCDENTEIVL